MSTLKANAVQTLTGKPILNSTGSILQMVQTVKTDTFTTASTTWTDLTGMSATITPSSTNNKVLVILTLCFHGDSNTQGYAKLVRGGTDIAIGDANGSRVRYTVNDYINQFNQASTSTAIFLDSPSSTSATTYKVQLQSQGVGTVYVNRSTTWTDSQNSGTGFSSLVLMEVSG
jgi:hypothetical protein